MNKHRRWIHKDRYGIVRSSIIMCALLLASLFVFFSLQGKQIIEFEKERSAAAAQQVSMAIEQLVQDSVSKLEGAASMIANEEADESDMLSGLIKFGKFRNAAIQRENKLYFADGSNVPSGNLTSYAANTETGALVFFADDRETIRMSMKINAGEQLVVWMDELLVNSIFYSAFQQPYSYAIFNSETGSFILNESPFGYDSYYDALLHLNNNGAAEELLNNLNSQARMHSVINEKDVCYIAQQQTTISPWAISLIIPEELLKDDEAFGMDYIPFAIAILVILLAVVILNAVLALRRIRIANQNTRRVFEVNDYMMQVSAQDTGVTVFLYNRAWDRILSCYDGLKLQGESKLLSLASLADCCRLESDGSDQLYDCIGKLVPGESAEIALQANANGQDARILRCSIHACDDGSKNVIFVIADATQQQAFVTRADIEKEFMESVQRKASSIWQVNVSRNRWHLINIRKDVHMPAQPGVWTDYSDDMRGKVREFIHPADFASVYEKHMDLEALNEAFRMGKTEFSCEYRVNGTKQDAYEWHRMQVRLWLDVRTNDVFANLYVYNVNAKKNAELERGERKRILNQAVTALGGMYFGLYYVDLENDLSYTARSLGGELVDQLCLPYKATFDEYIDNIVHPEEREALRKLLSAYFLRRNMTEGSHFQRAEYRRRVGDGRYVWSSIIVQPARFENGSVKEVVLAIRDIDKKSDADKI